MPLTTIYLNKITFFYKLAMNYLLSFQMFLEFQMPLFLLIWKQWAKIDIM